MASRTYSRHTKLLQAEELTSLGSEILDPVSPFMS